MVDGPKGKPTEERKREHRRGEGAGQLLEHFEGLLSSRRKVTLLPPGEPKIWNRKLGRYKYAAGAMFGFKHVGGKITSAPSSAPAERKKGYKKKRPRA